MASAPDETIERLLAMTRVAVVGCSGTPGKDAHVVPRYLREHGYDVVPVNPNRERVLGRATVDTLADVSGRVDLVVVFRPSDEVAGIVDQAIDRGDVVGIWTQLDIRDAAAASRAERGDIAVVQDRCIMVEHRRRR